MTPKFGVDEYDRVALATSGAKGAAELLDFPEHLPLGATYLGNGETLFCVWAPLAGSIGVKFVGDNPRTEALVGRSMGYYTGIVSDVKPGTRYLFRIDEEKEFPDPCSRSQPEGVHGPSEVIDPDFAWTDSGWNGMPLSRQVQYEMHVGTFSREGTFAAVIDRLDELQDLGINTLEILPIAQFPGGRNWGYDGTYPYAAQNTYGGPQEFKRLVNACHERGMAVCLDVVYNHLGPEGNYTGQYGHYFTEKYHTPWGSALNFDAPHSDGVRRFFIENALHWIRDFHVDALRLDAIHAIVDESARPFLKELATAVHAEAKRLGREVQVIEESNKNDSRHLEPVAAGGYGLDGVWADDFHHIVHTLVSGERDGYYADFGKFEQLVKAYREGFIFAGEYSQYRGRRHGVSSLHLPPEQFVVCIQNHDQVGNRLAGDRFGTMISAEKQKLAAGLLLTSPFVPMLFMGEEYGEKAPFPFFTSHGDADLIESVRRGRRAEFKAFAWQGDIPDPQAEETFNSAILNRELREVEPHRSIYALYKELLRLRRELPPLIELSKEQMDVVGLNDEKVLIVRRWHGAEQVLAIFHLTDQRRTCSIPAPSGRWTKLISSADVQWQGESTDMPREVVSDGSLSVPLAPFSFVLLHNAASRVQEFTNFRR